MATAPTLEDSNTQEEQESIRYISVPNAPDLYSITVGGIEYRNTAYKGRAE